MQAGLHCVPACLHAPLAHALTVSVNLTSLLDAPPPRRRRDKLILLLQHLVSSSTLARAARGHLPPARSAVILVAAALHCRCCEYEIERAGACGGDGARRGDAVR